MEFRNGKGQYNLAGFATEEATKEFVRLRQAWDWTQNGN